MCNFGGMNTQILIHMIFHCNLLFYSFVHTVLEMFKKSSALTKCNSTDESAGNGHHLHVACVQDTNCDQKKNLKIILKNDRCAYPVGCLLHSR